MTINIVLATDDVELRERFAVVLAEADDIEVVDSVQTVERIPVALQDRDADVLLLDDRLAGGRLREVVRETALAHPFVGVVLVTDDESPEAYASALETGARSTVSQPFSLEELRARLEQAAQWGRALRSHMTSDGGRGAERGRLVAVSGAKGGVGTTVLATLLAVESVTPGRGVCLVDLDLRGGTVGFYADVTARRSIADLAEVARDISGRSVREVAVDHAAGLSLILAPEDVERADDVTGEAARLVLGHLRTQFDVVVVDCGSTLDDTTAMVLEMADEVVLVATTDVVALRAARATMLGWERLSVRAPADVRFVLNRVSRRVEVQPELARRVVGIPVVAELPACFRELEGPLNAGRLVASPPVALAGPVRGLLRDLGLRDAAVARGSSAWGTRGSRRQGRVGAAGSRRREAGQVAVESPLVVALMVALALVCLQLVLWGVSGLLARHAALEGARSASVSDDPGAIRQAVADAMPDQWGGPSAVSTGGGTVRVTVRTPVLMPGLGGLDASSSASVLRERP